MIRPRPSLPIAVLLAIGPALAVAQFRAMALAVTVAFLATVAAHALAHRRLPWPRPGPVLLGAAALLGWGLLSAAWAPDPARVVQTVASLSALVLLAAMAARALAEDATENLRRLGPALAIGLGLGIAVAAFDYLSGHLFRAAVRGFPPVTPQLGLAIKPAVTVIVALLPLVLGVAALPLVLRLLVLAAGTLLALLATAESAKLAVLLALAAMGLAALAPRLAGRLSVVVAAGLLLTAPLLSGWAMARGPDVSGLPLSAAHRVLIWDYVTQRVAERPILGWGLEASRDLPGGTDTFPDATTSRFGLSGPGWDRFRAVAQQLPLHPHNAALQFWVELGAIGAALGAILAGLLMRRAARGGLAAAGLGAAVACFAIGQLSYGVWQPWWVATQALVLVTLIGLSEQRRRAG